MARKADRIAALSCILMELLDNDRMKQYRCDCFVNLWEIVIAAWWCFDAVGNNFAIRGER